MAAGGAGREDDNSGEGGRTAAGPAVTVLPKPAVSKFVDPGIERLPLPSMRGPFEDKVEGVQVRTWSAFCGRALLKGVEENRKSAKYSNIL